ncbi:MAG: 4-(cytidine 5'-diphospho)-2-C-methyl-D-erythritol kinase [Gammaproteobacteria bacterium]|nr:4-(cytidine 5'-diphospho)-2-C-methyl-D-erythritol kinase [Gammaproteobacteria bacterium]
MKMLSPAKLNLFLHIIGRRADGYHLLQTLYQLLDFGDLMEFAVDAGGVIEVTCPGLDLPPEQNLVFRAARLLQQHTGCSHGARVQVEKRIPAGGGLGGGSSNAATTLLALNRLWQLHLAPAELAQLGLSLGADVPVFIHGHSAWAEGVGEQLQPLAIDASWYVVIAPDCVVSSAEVFSQQQLTRNTAPIKIAAFFAQGGRNDCETVVRRLYPVVDKALNWLGKFGQAQMTGTGACVYTPVASEQQAQAIYQQLPANWEGFVARGINHSPVLAALGQ